MRKKLFWCIVSVMGIYLIVVLSRDLWHVWGVRSRVSEAEGKVRRLELEQATLSAQLKEAGEEDFVERVAREKLLLGKPGEMAVLLPLSGGIENEELRIENGQKEPELQNWQKWTQLIFYK